MAAWRSNGFEPPPSSMLAIRMADENDSIELNQTSFNQLLEESLGNDENGQPNLGADATVNLKVVEIVIKAGIDAYLTASQEGPFEVEVMDKSQFLICLQVIKTAIERSPNILTARTGAGVYGTRSKDVPLYAWLLPRLVSALMPSSPSDIGLAVSQLIRVCIQSPSDRQLGHSDAIADFLLGCISVLIAYTAQDLIGRDDRAVQLEDEKFAHRLWRHRPLCHGLAGRFCFKDTDHMLHAAAVVLRTLAGIHKSPSILVQFRKTLQALQNCLDDLSEAVSEGQRISSLSEEVRALDLRDSVEVSFTETAADDSDWPDSDRARKRPRLSDVDDDGSFQRTTRQQICRKLTYQLTGNAVDDLDALSATVSTRFKSSSEEQRLVMIKNLGTSVCQLGQDDNSATTCAACDSDSTIKAASDPAAPEILKTMLTIVPLIQRNSKDRPAAMQVLRRILLHSPPAESLSLHSTAGEWCLQCLRSSTRDLRFCALSVLQVYVMGNGVNSTTRDNRVIALDFLQSLWDTGDAASQETAVLALTRVAQVSGDEELNIILLRLVECLGHNNSYISGLVYEELQQLAQYKQVTTTMLFRPFWRTIGLVVAKTMSFKGSIAELLCSLLGLQLSGLMLLVEEHSLPYLVLHQKLGTIQQYATAHGSSTTPFDICTTPQNLSAILSYLLIQSYQDPEQKVMEILIAVSDDFAADDLGGWLNHDPIKIACILLKSIGDAAEGRSSRTYQALQFLAAVLLRKPNQHISSSRRSETLGAFLESHALAIVTHFTVLLNDLETKEPKLEKKRSIIALGEIVKLGKSRVARALPQICACLRASLPDDDLCNAAFHSWVAVIKSLKEEDLAPLVDQTAAIIIKHWAQFSSQSQKLAYDVIADLLKNHTELIRDIFDTFPTFAQIPMLSKFETEIKSLQRQMDERRAIAAFVERLQDENEIVVEQALVELKPLLQQKQDLLFRSITREKPEVFVAELTRALLDACVRFPTNTNISALCGHCLGSIGCLDPNKIETIVDRKSVVVPSNFSKAEETVDFIMYFLEHVLVKAFLSASTTRSQGFLGWAMQELLNLCHDGDSSLPRVRSGPSTAYRRWNDMPEGVRNTLAPFQTSKYRVQQMREPEKRQYPLYTPGMAHKDWIRALVTDFLHRAPGNNIRLIYDICCRIIQGQDLAIPSFLLPYTVLTLITSGIEKDFQDVLAEILNILQQPLIGQDRQVQEDIRSCSQSIFDILDYFSRYLQHRRKGYTQAVRNDRGGSDVGIQVAEEHIKAVERLLGQIPPDILSRRAIECKSYARALFHWEQHIRKSGSGVRTDADLARLQDIYAQIDEPDGIEGISANMAFVSVEGRVLEHKKAGRWTTAQGWYQMHLTDHPDDMEAQRDLVLCLRESGQHHMLLDHYDSLTASSQLPVVQLKPFATEAAWATCRWNDLSKLVSVSPNDDFSSSVARSLLHAQKNDNHEASILLEDLYKSTALELTPTAIISLENSHDTLRRLHTIEDVRLLLTTDKEHKSEAMSALRKRLDILGSNVRDKQYLLTLWRAAMRVKSQVFDDADVASTWLISARLARKARASTQAFDAVLAATTLGDKSASIEEAKLIWQDGHHRKAIQTLEGAISSGAFIAHNYVAEDGPVTLTTEQQNYQNELTGKAYLLLGKWLDRAGQTSSDEIRNTFRKSTDNFRKWEKGWYHLGRYYNKLLDSQKLLPPGKESQQYLTGELAKLVIENYLRSLMNGSKFIFQTLPKVLTLWFELVAGDLPSDPRRGNEKFLQHNNATRKKIVDDCNKYIQKYVDRIQAAVLYTVLPQVAARICHTNPTVYNILTTMMVKIVRAFPNQALWTLLAISKSQSKDRGTRGINIISKVVEAQKRQSTNILTPSELRNLIAGGQRFSDELLRISELPIEGKVSKVSLAKDFGFNHKIAPSRLVVPCEACLIGSIPTSYDSGYLKTFRAFDKDPVTIQAFLDDALVLSSLQKPRKLTIRGTNGQLYGVLAKPKDDLRKDQRLMEFNTMINRFLKRDVEASKRRLYIRTYAVIPLNEECGLIEWVDNLKTFRDIILKLYKDRSITPNYGEIRNLLDKSCAAAPDSYAIFTDQILTTFPAVFHEWFVESFPDPAAWFAARLRYTRSCAVMSIVGHVLGLGDRHGENILFEEDNGSLMHVDFNCLFDKGLTFEKPEHVPFRLTHNLVDAMGPYGYEGPWRRCSEITLHLLRNNEDALMTVLETFLHDPTTDFLERERRKKRAVPGVPNSPLEVMESVRGKVKGFLMGESVPLSVEGYVQEMARQATERGNLCRMYIGWCAFF